jgi:hypothetical protein
MRRSRPLFALAVVVSGLTPACAAETGAAPDEREDRAQLDLASPDLAPEGEPALRARALFWYGTLVRSPAIGDRLAIAVAWMRGGVTLMNAEVPPPKVGLHILREDEPAR